MKNNLTKKLVKLASENPDLPIIASTNFEVIGGDEYDYWVGELSEVFVDYGYLSESLGKWIWGEDEIKEAFYEEQERCDYDFFEDMDGKEVQKFLDDRYDKLVDRKKKKKYIIMRIDP